MSLFPNTTIYPGPFVFPGSNVYPGHFRHTFIGPTEDYHVRLEGNLIATMQAGLDVWRAGGVWHTTSMTSAEQRASADRFYGGGRLNPLTEAERIELIVAGFGAYIVSEEIT